MDLKDICLTLDKNKVQYKLVSQNNDLSQSISDINLDSRTQKDQNLFLAFKTPRYDRNDFLEQAIENGASLIISDANISLLTKLSQSYQSIIIISCPVLSTEYYHIFNSYYHIEKTPNLFFITGTNGKTSVAFFIHQFLIFLQETSCYSGTIGLYSTAQTPYSSNNNLTTPDIKELYKIIQYTQKHNINNLIIETSSHGLDQDRLLGLKANIAALTNITPEHLDYHHSFEHYKKSKFKLISNYTQLNGTAILNADIPEHEELILLCNTYKIKYVDYGYHANNGIKFIEIKSYLNHSLTKVLYQGQEYIIKSSLCGEFNIYNLACAILSVLNNNPSIDFSELISLSDKIQAPPGRMQKIIHDDTRNILILVDFAHTADALKNILSSVKTYKHNRLICVFGCGGDRDPTKRPEMGLIASQIADISIVTDDNPRTEKPSLIRQEIIDGMKENAIYYNSESRYEAIWHAISLARQDDIILVTGKGHEEYQIIGTEKHPFSDKEVIRSIYKKIYKDQ